MKSNEEWSSQLLTQFMQLRKEAWEKYQDFNGAYINPPNHTVSLAPPRSMNVHRQTCRGYSLKR